MKNTFHLCVSCPICRGDMCLTTHEIIYEYNKKIILKFLEEERIKAPISVEWYLIRIKERMEKEENEH